MRRALVPSGGEGCPQAGARPAEGCRHCPATLQEPRGEGYYKGDAKEEDLRYSQAPANAIATNP